jgi:trans-aconitate methyltransferase
MLLPAIHKLINSITIAPIHKKGDKLTVIITVEYHCYQHHTKILSNVLLSSLGPYVDAIIEDHQCRFRHNRSTTDHIFCIRQILKNK